MAYQNDLLYYINQMPLHSYRLADNSINFFKLIQMYHKTNDAFNISVSYSYISLHWSS
jgi:hypothetical protein